MDNYKPNSDKGRKEQPEKRVANPVAVGKTRKKGEIQKFADVFIAEDVHNVKTYLFSEVIVPAVKKAISDMVTTGIDMILYGESGRRSKNGPAAKVSYHNYYDRDERRVYAGSGGGTNRFDYDEIVFTSRGDADAVLDSMTDILQQFGMVSVADLFDLSKVPNDNFTMNRYGWTNLSGASIVRVRDGYIIKLPRAISLN